MDVVQRCAVVIWMYGALALGILVVVLPMLSLVLIGSLWTGGVLDWAMMDLASPWVLRIFSLAALWLGARTVTHRYSTLSPAALMVGASLGLTCGWLLAPVVAKALTPLPTLMGEPGGVGADLAGLVGLTCVGLGVLCATFVRSRKGAKS